MMEGCKCTDTEFCLHVCRNLGGCKRFEFLGVKKEKKPMKIKWHEEKKKKPCKHCYHVMEEGFRYRYGKSAWFPQRIIQVQQEERGIWNKTGWAICCYSTRDERCISRLENITHCPWCGTELKVRPKT